MAPLGRSLIQGYFPDDINDNAKTNYIGGIRIVITHLTDQFIKEVILVTSEYLALSDTLSDTQVRIPLQVCH